MRDDSAIKNFAALLAQETDEAARARLLARVKMLAAQDAPDEAFEPPIRNLGEYLASPIEVPPVLVHPFMVVRGGLHATIGRAGKGKTVMNLNRILRWSAGLPLFDDWLDAEGDELLRPEDALRILVVENEGAAGLFHRQIGIMLHAQEFLSDEDRTKAKENVLIWGDGGYSDLKFDDPNKLNHLRAGIEKHEPDIVFVEPFRTLWKGEENSATEMQVVVDALMNVAADYNCACMIAHHESKHGGDSDEKMSRARGSTVLEGAVTIMENFEGVKGGDFRELSWSKSRHGMAPNPVRMEWVPEAWWYRHVPTSQIDEAIITALRNNADEPMSVADLAEETGETKTLIRKHCKRLKDEDRLRQLPSIYSGDGSTGNRYAVATEADADFGGLAV